MLVEWRDQQLSRNLRAETVRTRLLAVRRFQRFMNDWPWLWRPVDVEEFTTELRGEGRTLATVRAYQGSLRQFLDYVCDPRYQCTATCQRLFGTHPAQVCFEWNTAVHVAEHEGRPSRRALTKLELQRLFDHADDQVTVARSTGRKGWLAAMRDSVTLKCAYAWGLRRRELVMLEIGNFGSNPRAPELGEYGLLYVR
jgi:integrase/recombinase XerC